MRHAARDTLQSMGQREEVGNERIAARLDEFAALLELADAGYYSARAYRRAAERVRAAPVDIAALVRVRPHPGAAGHRPGHRSASSRADRDRRHCGARGAEAIDAARACGVRSHARHRSEARRRHRGRTRDHDRPGVPRRQRQPGACSRCRESAPRRKRGSSRRSSAREVRGRPVSCCHALERSPSRLQLRSAESRRETRGVGRTSRSASRSSSARTIRKACASASRPCPRSLRCSIPTPGSRPTGSRSSWSRRPPPSSARLSCARLGHPSTSPRWGRCPRRPTRRPCTADSACHARRLRSVPLASRLSRRRSWNCTRSAETCIRTRPGRTAARPCSRWARPRGSEATSTSRSAITRRTSGS